MKKIACVGIMVCDVIVEPVTNYPQKGLLLPVDSITMHNGGNAMTAAINISKMGGEVSLIGRVGQDMFGEFLKERLVKNGVDVSGVKSAEGAQTSSSVLMIDSVSGERSFFHCVGANGVFNIDDVDFGVIEQCDIVFVTGTFLMKKFDGEQTAEFLKKCKEMGKTTALDVCWDASGQWGELLNQAMPYIDIFLPSVDEARMIAGKDTPAEMADEFFNNGVKSVIIKCGSEGCYFRWNKEDEGCMIPCFKVDEVVDTTGAGDSFCSGFLAAYARGEEPKVCATIGNATGALCVMQKGATSGTRSYEDTIKFMEDKINACKS